jgi:hypothetical protein
MLAVGIQVESEGIPSLDLMLYRKEIVPRCIRLFGSALNEIMSSGTA